MTILSARSVVAQVIAVAITLMSAGSLQAQLQGVTRLEGKILDEKNNPVSCKIFFVTPSGKKVDISSKTDGTYLQTFNEAGTVRMLFKGHNVYYQETSVEIPKNTKFQAIEKNFSVRAVVEGTVLGSGRWFDLNTTTITNEGRTKINEILQTLAQNPQMRIVVNVAPDMDQLVSVKAKLEADYAKAYADWQKAVKKTKKNQTPPAEPMRATPPADPNPALVQSRIAALKATFKEVANGDERITYSSKELPASAMAAPTPVQVVEASTTGTGKKKGKPTKQQPSNATQGTSVAASMPTHPTVVIAIGQVKKLF